jgi:UDP-2,3-diacylglucosamine hydrolase
VTASLPAFGTWQADPAWRCIDLLSDVHLHADMPHTFAAWRDHLLATPADAVLILGDLFEVWVGDDSAASGFAADCVAVLRRASRQRALAFLPGNRDFLVGDALLATTGLQALADPTVLQAFGQRWLLTHGDALCLADTAYQRFRQQVRSPDWQQAFLAQPLAERERQARVMRDASAAHQAGMDPAAWSDVDDNAAAQWLAGAGCAALIHGHTHRPASHALPGGGSRHVLGDWDFDHGTPRARALRLTADGLQVLDLAA